MCIRDRLESGPQVLATGGGAFMNVKTRDAIRAKGVSIWLKAEFEVLLRRISKRRNERPLLQTDDPAETLRTLLAVSYTHLDVYKRQRRDHGAAAARSAAGAAAGHGSAQDCLLYTSRCV